MQHAGEAGGDGQDTHKKELSSLKGAETGRRQQARKIKGLSEPPAYQLCPFIQGWGQSGKGTNSLRPLSQLPLPWESSISQSAPPISALLS